MKTILAMGVLLGLFLACSKDEASIPQLDPIQQPDPVPVANFAVDQKIVEVGLPVMFDNLSLNAIRYEWDFGTGLNSSTDISPTVIFDTTGEVIVSLKAFSEDGQIKEMTKIIQVTERVLTSYFVIAFPPLNGRDHWDPGLAGNERFADIFIQFLPVNPNNPIDFRDGIFGNIPFGPFGNILDPINPDRRIVLTNEDWTFTLFDFDGVDPGNINEKNIEFMIGVQFNPVVADTFKNSTGDGGTISVSFVKNDGTLLALNLKFELQ